MSSISTGVITSAVDASGFETLRGRVRRIQQQMPVPKYEDEDRITAAVAIEILGISRYMFFRIMKDGDPTYDGTLKVYHMHPYKVGYYSYKEVMAYKQFLDEQNKAAESDGAHP